MPTEYDNIDVIGTTHESSKNSTEEKMNSYYHKQEVSTVKELLQKLHSRNFESVIDLGCSVGTWYTDFKNFGFKDVIGIDISEQRAERSKKKGVYIKEMSKSDYLQYRMMSIEVGKDSPLTKREIEKQWDLFTHAGYGGFFAYENEIPVGGISISFFNGYVNEFNIVRTQRDITEKLYSQDLLKWKIIEWANENGFRYFDLSGANPKPTNQKEIGILRYKKKWGGDLKFYSQITL